MMRTSFTVTDDIIPECIDGTVIEVASGCLLELSDLDDGGL